MTLNQKPIPPVKTSLAPLVNAAANDEHVVAAIGLPAWGSRAPTVTRRIATLLVQIDELHTIGHSPARQVACSELGDLLASFAIDYLKAVANDSNHSAAQEGEQS